MKWKIQPSDPPELKKAYAAKIVWILAFVMIAFAVVHLIRIDKLVPLFNDSLNNAGTLFVVAIVTIEVFALPYLLRLRVSPLMRLMSGFFVVLAPLLWLCLSIWLYGTVDTTGQFSSYVSTPATWWLIVLNAGWLAVSYFGLWLSGYNNVSAVLRKTR